MKYFIGWYLSPIENYAVKNTQETIRRIFREIPEPNTPPHLTLAPPFETNQEELLIELLKTTAKNFRQFQVNVNSYGAFKEPKPVIFLDVERNQSLIDLREGIIRTLTSTSMIEKEPSFPFYPHITLFSKGLSEKNFSSIFNMLGGGLSPMFSSTVKEIVLTRKVKDTEPWTSTASIPLRN